jgi:hypothetical protein
VASAVSRAGHSGGACLALTSLKSSTPEAMSSEKETIKVSVRAMYHILPA